MTGPMNTSITVGETNYGFTDSDLNNMTLAELEMFINNMIDSVNVASGTDINRVNADTIIENAINSNDENKAAINIDLWCCDHTGSTNRCYAASRINESIVAVKNGQTAMWDWGTLYNYYYGVTQFVGEILVYSDFLAREVDSLYYNDNWFVSTLGLFSSSASNYIAKRDIYEHYINLYNRVTSEAFNRSRNKRRIKNELLYKNTTNLRSNVNSWISSYFNNFIDYSSVNEVITSKIGTVMSVYLNGVLFSDCSSITSLNKKKSLIASFARDSYYRYNIYYETPPSNTVPGAGTWDENSMFYNTVRSYDNYYDYCTNIDNNRNGKLNTFRYPLNYSNGILSLSYNQMKQRAKTLASKTIGNEAYGSKIITMKNIINNLHTDAVERAKRLEKLLGNKI